MSMNHYLEPGGSIPVCEATGSGLSLDTRASKVTCAACVDYLMENTYLHLWVTGVRVFCGRDVRAILKRDLPGSVTCPECLEHMTRLGIGEVARPTGPVSVRNALLSYFGGPYRTPGETYAKGWGKVAQTEAFEAMPKAKWRPWTLDEVPVGQVLGVSKYVGSPWVTKTVIVEAYMISSEEGGDALRIVLGAGGTYSAVELLRDWRFRMEDGGRCGIEE